MEYTAWLHEEVIEDRLPSTLQNTAGQNVALWAQRAFDQRNGLGDCSNDLEQNDLEQVLAHARPTHEVLALVSTCSSHTLPVKYVEW